MSTKIKDYNYELPQEKIARYPLEKRDESKLLIYKDGKISDDKFFNLDKYLQSGSLMIFNNTKVIKARIFFYKSTGAEIEILLLEPADCKTYEEALSSSGKSKWNCIIGNASKWKHGSLKKILKKNNDAITLEVQYALSEEQLKKTRDYFTLEFTWDGDISFSEILDLTADVPLPPYLHRKADKNDIERYQTVYADINGSVAAPTSGLHFTNDVLNKLKERNIISENITLHIGAGTFKPVKSKTIEEHTMHSEKIFFTKSFLDNLLTHLGNSPVISVGTTSMRAVESLYWLAADLKNGKIESLKPEFMISQWEPYRQKISDKISAADSIKILLDDMEKENLDMISGQTQIIIMPGYKIRYFDALITNFHLPESTLLLLIAAFIGDKWREVYDYALMNDFRFLSYGDSSILFK